ncbi:sensor histidine kinase [Lewinella sp. W8]|uniref:sensor histidine kinase n=1 Tax=Lewinella sp. W8 TaxID=2528208 RepID=UPI00106722A3|nr:histidine kinase [Lewinella sp. W8]MTB50210.1 histidine kinase [Lewinella sp. W8]
MNQEKTTTFSKWISRESLFQLALWVLYFFVLIQQIDYYNERTGKNVTLGLRHFVFAINYLIVILLISYWVLPKFLYRKRYFTAVALMILFLCTGILVEEFVMEKIFFGNEGPGQQFPGFLPTLWDIGPTIVFFVCAKLAWDNLKKQNVLEELEKERAESQLQFLKSQLNPHFLFNNLNNLYSYAQEGSPKTSEIILQLSAIMRYMLYESKENFVDLSKEIQYLGDFIKLQELQMEDRGRVHFQVNGQPQGKLIAPLVLITFVENSFKHSMSGQADDIDISIVADIEEDELHFRCENTFQAAENASNEYLTSGIGLANTRKRLELLYPGDHSLEAGPQGDRYVVDLRLPLSSRKQATGRMVTAGKVLVQEPLA